MGKAKITFHVDFSGITFDFSLTPLTTVGQLLQQLQLISGIPKERQILGNFTYSDPDVPTPLFL